MRLYYDTKEDRYYSCRFDHGAYTPKQRVEDVTKYHAFLVEVTNRRPDEWVGPPAGNPGDGVAPAELNTTIRTIYQQHGNRYCLTFSLASALFYCGFRWAAELLAEQAQNFAAFHYDESIAELRSFMTNLVPLIGLPTLFGIRTKRSSRVKRWLTWDDLFTKLTPYPTIVIPMSPTRGATHAFCVVDDLIFDSITPHAMKLQQKSIDWIFNNEKVDLYQALRFNMKFTPKGMKVEGKYERDVSLHWQQTAIDNNL